MTKLVRVSQIRKQQKQLEEKKKNDSLREFELRTVVGTFFNVFLTGLTALMRQKIAEASMIANQAPGELDWEVIPENSIYGDPMDVDPQLDEWEDVFEEDLGAEGQTVGQKTMRHAELQSIITCVVILLPLSCISDYSVGLLVAAKISHIPSVHNFYADVLQKESGTLFCHYLSTHILNGGTAVQPPVPRLNRMSFGQYLCWDSKVWYVNPSMSCCLSEF